MGLQYSIAQLRSPEAPAPGEDISNTYNRPLRSDALDLGTIRGFLRPAAPSRTVEQGPVFMRVWECIR
jgi:hypothetical protein